MMRVAPAPQVAVGSPDGNPLTLDLFASLGSYNGNNSASGDNGNNSYGTYHTVEIACESIIGPCFDGSPALIDPQMLANSSGLMNPGGLSLTSSSDAQYALFAAPGNGFGSDSWEPRGLYFEPTVSAAGVYGPLNSLPTAEGPSTPPQPSGGVR